MVQDVHCRPVLSRIVYIYVFIPPPPQDVKCISMRVMKFTICSPSPTDANATHQIKRYLVAKYRNIQKLILH